MASTNSPFTKTPPPEVEKFVPKDALGAAVTATLISAGAGAFISGTQNALAKENRGIWGVFTRTGSTIGVFAAVGGTYTFVREVSANLREKNDSWNPAIGGFFGGAILGIRSRSIASVIGYGAGTAAILATFDYAGGTLRGNKDDPIVDEVGRKEFMRKNRRLPYEETLENLHGMEGRGIYSPGYADRRRQRLADRYGIELPAESVKPYA